MLEVDNVKFPFLSTQQIGSIEAHLNGPSSESMLLYSGDPLAYELCVTLSTQEYIQIYEHSNWTVGQSVYITFL